jgi:non-lysosomal glucosylceramidase
MKNIMMAFTIAAAMIVTGPCLAQIDYGADAASNTFGPGGGGGRGHDYNYLALRDHIGPSGVPLGGIGAGCFDLAPDGQFTRMGVNNTFDILRGETTKGFFLALWEKPAKNKPAVARRLVRDSQTFLGMKGMDHTVYRGLFPDATMTFSQDGGPFFDSRVSLHAWSGLIPQNVKDSSLPAVWFDVTLANTSPRATEVSVAFSWSDIIGQGIKDVEDLDKVPESTFKVNDAKWGVMPKAPAKAEAFDAGDWKGVRQFTDSPIRPKKLTFQNYNTDMVIIAEQQKDAQITFLPAYEIRKGDDAWQPFRQEGVFSSVANDTNLGRDGGPAMASAIAVKAKLKGSEKRTLRFMVAWYMPEMEPDRQNGHPRSYFGQGDYSRYYHNYFKNIQSLADYTTVEGHRILQQTQEWQTLILESNLPDWLKFKLINCGYTLYCNTLLNKVGDFSVMEGGMGGLAGTMDQRLVAHPVYQKLFTKLDRSEMQLFADSQGPKGDIMHFCGSYYVGLASSKGGPSPTANSSMTDNSCAWIIQLAKDYQQTGDLDYLKRNADHLRKSLAYLKSKIIGKTDVLGGATTYDDRQHPPMFSYLASVYLTTLQAGQAAADALGDTVMADDCKKQYLASQTAFIKYFWNGRFFAYGCDTNGLNRRDDVIFTGQMPSQFLSRYCGWGDPIPLDMTQAALVSMFKTSLSFAPDYYAPKYFDLQMMSSVDIPGSQCFPFQLENFTAMAAIQTGYVADGLDIMKHIQLVHLRNGWTWSQNIWNPAELTYMSAPVTWFITDVLSGAALDIPTCTLTLGPAVLPGEDRLTVPLCFPRFWAQLDYQPTFGKASLRILKTFGEENIVLRNLVGRPVGVAASADRKQTFTPFTVKQGAVLDLSPHLKVISGGVSQRPVLSRAGQEPFRYVQVKQK